MKQQLKFDSEGRFKILQLTDIHYTFDNEDDKRAVSMAKDLISREDPDFIMLTGDIVFGENNLSYIDKAFAPVIGSGKPWGFVFGNHDVEFNSTREEFFSEVIKRPGCISYHDPDSVDGMGNCFLEVQNQAGEAKWILLGIDSGDYNRMKEVGGYGYVTSSQIAWYRKKMKEYKEKYSSFSVMTFMHMALPEHKEVWDYSECYGSKLEGVCSPYVNSGFFTAMLEEGHMKAVFVGHDHMNDYWGMHFGIALGFGRYSGNSSYGSADYLRGGRVFIINEADTSGFETYVCLENGKQLKEPFVNLPKKKRE